LTGVLTYQREGNIFALRIDTKADRKIVDFPATAPAIFSARSPDGRQLAYVRIEGMGCTLWIANPDGGDARKIVDESTGTATLERPQWTPDGKSIIYTYHGFVIEGGAIKGEVFRAERVDPDGSNRTVLAPDAEGPTMAPDGSLAFVRTTRSGQQLVVLEPGGTERVLAAERSFLNLAAPRYSPDGTRIAFTAVGEGPKTGSRPGGLGWSFGPSIAYAHGEPWDIWMAESDGKLRLASKLTEDEPMVGWSPDGRYLAASGGTGVYVIEAAGGQTTQLGKQGGFGGIDWTP
jgi:Tol biopolymer transport system component